MKKLIIALTLVTFIGAGAFAQTKSSAKVVSNDTKIEKVSYDQDPAKSKDASKSATDAKISVSGDQKAASSAKECAPAKSVNCAPEKSAGCTPKPGCTTTQKSCCSKSHDPAKK
ncbi:MAG TPA: hypothetical protein PK711_11165 [Bacteroidales bacterium]|nr:hypothetical protein [Bacteroidales bacterium]HRZ20369.1 hypothetical protein [Bacteroidales bacterium]